jgi:hypothetical protein
MPQRIKLTGYELISFGCRYCAVVTLSLSALSPNNDACSRSDCQNDAFFVSFAKFK